MNNRRTTVTYGHVRVEIEHDDPDDIESGMTVYVGKLYGEMLEAVKVPYNEPEILERIGFEKEDNDE